MRHAIETEAVIAAYDRNLDRYPEDADVLAKFTCALFGVSDGRLLPSKSCARKADTQTRRTVFTRDSRLAKISD